MSKIEAHDVLIRVIGDLAIIHARTTYVTPPGKVGGGRYLGRSGKRGLPVIGYFYPHGPRFICRVGRAVDRGPIGAIDGARRNTAR